MNDYGAHVNREAAICTANYAVDEHPYDKNPESPETFSDYNRGWNDACDYIEEKLESLPTVPGVIQLFDEAVVHCRDCKYDYTIECPLCYIEQQTLCFVNHNGDFFCAKGKREVDEEDG